MNQMPLPMTAAPIEGWTPDTPPDLRRFTEVSLDAESDGLDRFKSRPCGWAVSAGNPGDRPHERQYWYLPFAHKDGGNLSEEQVKAWARGELRGKAIRNLHTKFDLHLSESWGVNLREQGNTFRDVAHTEALLDDHEKRFNLSHLAKKRLGQDKLDPGDAHLIHHQHASNIAEYAKQDVRLVDMLEDHYAPMIAAEKLTSVQRIEDGIIPVVVEMERNGMRLNLDLLSQWEEQSKRLWEDMTMSLYRRTGLMVNPDSSESMTKLWQTCGLPITHFTAHGKASFPEPVVAAAAQLDDRIMLAWRVGKLFDLRTKYLQKYLREHVNGYIYPTLNQLMTDEGGTVSGRFSCVKPNLQQVMGKDKHKNLYKWLEEYGADFLIKRLFIPADGKVWVTADMKQVEYRVFAHYSESENILGTYLDPNPRMDPTGKFWVSGPLADFHEMVAEMIRPIKPNITRTEVKQCNFLKVFGGGMPALRRVLPNASDADLYALSAAYDARFPEAGALADRCKAAASDRGWVRTFFGRRSRFLMGITTFPDGRTRKERQRTHKALNAIVQGTAADINKLALIDLYEQRHALGFTMRLTTHDSIDGDLESPDQIVPFLARLDQQRVPLRCPILWDGGVGENWADAK